MEHLVTIIVPVYNAESSLDKCLSSVLTQTYQQFELIVVNDGSLDNSSRIMDTYVKQDQRVIAINIENGGVSNARNVGIDAARGQYILFLDADDSLEAKALELLVNAREKSGANLVVGNYNNNSQRVRNSFNPPILTDQYLGKSDLLEYVQGFLAKPTGKSTFIYIWSKLFMTAIIKDNGIYFNDSLKVGEDTLFNFEYLRHVNGLFFVEEPVYNYTVSTRTSAGSNVVAFPLSYLNSYEPIKALFNGIQIDKQLGHWVIHFAIKVIFQIVGMSVRDPVSVPYGKMKAAITQVVSEPKIRENLSFYTPDADDSLFVYWLMKLKTSRLIIFRCKMKIKYGL